MPVNPYFNHYYSVRTPEQSLTEDLITESIQIYGTDCYYIPRESFSSQDLIFGEDPTSKFSSAYVLDMYINSGNEPGGHYSGMNDMFSKFGLEIRDDSNFIVSMRTFKRYVPTNVRERPNEGDLIWVPVQNKMYEIKFTEPDLLFFQLGKSDKYIFEMRCEGFRFSNEDVNTGVESIDDAMENNAFTIQLQLLSGGAGDYNIGEYVYIGDDFTTANSIAEVFNWNPTTKIIDLINTKDEFVANTVLKGFTSNATYTIGTTDELGNHTINDYKDNKDLQTFANTILDRTETNPMNLGGIV